MTEYARLAEGALDELREATLKIAPQDADAFVSELAAARRIALYGVGREGLMMRALAMRLYHMGLDAHVVGDMSCPPLGEGDCLVVSAGPGRFSTVEALVDVAQRAGARAICVTAQPDGAVPQRCDGVFVLPAQTMADDQANEGPASVLPMGSLYEGVQYVAFELVILLLRERLGVTPEAMRARHTNLE